VRLQVHMEAISRTVVVVVLSDCLVKDGYERCASVNLNGYLDLGYDTTGWKLTLLSLFQLKQHHLQLTFQRAKAKKLLFDLRTGIGP
jgi:hypothetical protein